MKTSQSRQSRLSVVRSLAPKRRTAIKGTNVRVCFVWPIFRDYLLSLRERAADHYRRVYSIDVLITPNSVRIRTIARSLRAWIKCIGILTSIMTIPSYRLLQWICFQFCFRVRIGINVKYIYDSNKRLSLFLRKILYRKQIVY